MGEAAVQEIVSQIQRLPEADCDLLRQRLDELAESEWQREAQSARRLASERGIDEAAIDSAIRDLRRGGRSGLTLLR